MGHDQRSPQECGAHCREHRREAHPTVGCHAWRAVSSRPRTHTHRPRRCRPRPGNRQEHHPSTRRNPHPHPPGRWRALRHGATTRRATAHWQMTIRELPPRLRGSQCGPAMAVTVSPLTLVRIPYPQGREDGTMVSLLWPFPSRTIAWTLFPRQFGGRHVQGCFSACPSARVARGRCLLGGDRRRRVGRDIGQALCEARRRPLRAQTPVQRRRQGPARGRGARRAISDGRHPGRARRPPERRWDEHALHEPRAHLRPAFGARRGWRQEPWRHHLALDVGRRRQPGGGPSGL